LHRAVSAAARGVPTIQPLLERSIVSRVEAAGADVALTVEAGLSPSSVKAIRRSGVVCALWFPDAVVNLGRHVMYLADYDAIFVKDRALALRSRSLLNV